MAAHAPVPSESASASPESVASLDAEAWNLTRFDPSRPDPTRGHVESTFLKLNDPRAPRALWVKLTLFAPAGRRGGDTVAEAWAIAFDREGDQAAHVAAKRTVPIAEATLARARPFRLDVAGVRYSAEGGPRRLVGAIEHAGSRIRFDLAIEARDRAPFVPFPWPAMYRGRFPKSKTVSPILDGRATGEVVVERASGAKRRWDVEDWPAMQGHNWGAGHADLYAWAHCNAWNEPEGRDVVFEGFSGRVKVGPLTTPLITIVGLRHRGVRYEVRALPELARARGAIDAHRRWRFRARQAGATIEGDFELRDEDTVGLYYPNPTGELTYCLNSKIAHARLRVALPGRAPLVLTSDAAALEIGTKDPTHGVRMYV